MSDWDDSHLWEQYRNAATEEERKVAVGEIVWFHNRFVHQLANELAFKKWSHETKEEWFHEVFAQACQLVPSFNPDKASFLTFLRRSIRPSDAWVFDGTINTVSLKRDSAVALHKLTKLKDELKPMPVEQLYAEYLKRWPNDRLSFKRAKRLLEFESPTNEVEMLVTSDNPADIVVRREEQGANERQVELLYEALAAEVTSEMDHDLLRHFFLDLSLKDIAKAHKCSGQMVTYRKRQLLDRLRVHLEREATPLHT